MRVCDQNPPSTPLSSSHSIVWTFFPSYLIFLQQPIRHSFIVIIKLIKVNWRKFPDFFSFCLSFPFPMSSTDTLFHIPLHPCLLSLPLDSLSLSLYLLSIHYSSSWCSRCNYPPPFLSCGRSQILRHITGTIQFVSCWKSSDNWERKERTRNEEGERGGEEVWETKVHFLYTWYHIYDTYISSQVFPPLISVLLLLPSSEFLSFSSFLLFLSSCSSVQVATYFSIICHHRQLESRINNTLKPSFLPSLSFYYNSFCYNSFCYKYRCKFHLKSHFFQRTKFSSCAKSVSRVLTINASFLLSWASFFTFSISSFGECPSRVKSTRTIPLSTFGHLWEGGLLFSISSFTSY